MEIGKSDCQRMLAIEILFFHWRIQLDASKDTPTGHLELFTYTNFSKAK